MFGLFKNAGQASAGRFSRDRVLNEALHHHTKTYFYSGQALAALSDEAKLALIADLRARIATIESSNDSRSLIRQHLSDFVLLYAGVAALALTEDERPLMEFGRNPFITGELHRHIRDAAANHGELAPLLSQGASNEELMSFANKRAAVALYFANAFNMVRIQNGDVTQPDWYRPFVEAMLVWEEDDMRDRLAMPRLVRGEVYGLAYYSFLEIVLSGEPDPLNAWQNRWSELPLGSH